MRQNVLFEATNEDLIRELDRRLKEVGSSISAPAVPNVNAARQQKIRALRSSSPRGEPMEILRFLVEQRGTPQTMPNIADHMHTREYRASRYYDACNALADLGLAETSYRGGEKAWEATQAGTDFLSAHQSARRSGSNK
jgi:hypothetical protein